MERGRERRKERGREAGERDSERRGEERIGEEMRDYTVHLNRDCVIEAGELCRTIYV